MSAERKSSRQIETKPLPVGGQMLALEPRYVFDAAIATELHDLAHVGAADHGATVEHHDVGAAIVEASRALAATGEGGAHADRSTSVDLEALVRAHNLAPSNHEIAFVDTRLADLRTLIDAIPEGTRVVLIDASRDGVAQMVDALKGETGITGIHILSHGSDGHIELGTSSIDADTMSSIYRPALSSMHGNLAAGADILVYGCDFGAGATGARAAAMLAELTGADVAASTNLTGGIQGADWTLEADTGSIETRSVVAADWHHEMLDISAVNGASTAIKNTDATGDLSPQVTAINPPAPVTFTAGTFATAKGGSVTIQADGHYTYTPPAGYLGKDTFSFEASATDPNDNITQTASAVETITVNPDPGFVISAVGETNTVPYERSFSGTIADNVTASSKGGPITSYTVTSTTAHGTLLVNPDGTYTYTPDAGFSGQDTFTFQADDASPDSDPATATVILNVDPPPLVAHPYDTYVEVNHPVTVRPPVTEVDGAATVTYVPGTSPDGTLTYNNDGTFTFQPNPGFVGDTTVTYTVTDSNGYQSQSTINIHYTGAGSGGIAPITAYPDTYTVRQGDTAYQGVDYSETNSNGVAPVYHVTFDTLPAHGTISNFDPNTGNYDYIADPGYLGPDSFNFTVTDQYGQHASSTEHINIVKPDLSVASSVKFAAIGASVPGSLAGETTESAGNTTEVYAINGTTLSNGAIIPTAHGSLTVTNASTGAYTWQPNVGFSGVEVIDWSVKNVWGPGPNDFYETKASTDTIVSPNRIYAGHHGYTIPDNTTKTGTVASFSGSPNGTPSYTPTFAPSHGSVTLGPDGSYSYTPTAGYHGLDKFGYKIDNGLGNTATGYVTIYVAGPMMPGNTTPTSDEIPPRTNLDSDTPVGVSVASHFTDPNGDPLTFSADGLPPGLVMNPDGSITGTIDKSASQGADLQDGRYSVTVFADDGKGGVAQQSFEWVVTNPAPIANPASMTAAAMTPVVVPLLANDSDPDGDALTVTSASVSSAQGSLSQDAGGNWVFTSASGFTGPATISYTITDADGATATSTHTVVVGPRAVSDTYTTPFETAINGDVKAADTYLAGSTFVKTGDPTHGSVTYNADGTYTYTPDAGFTGTDTFTYRVTDPNGLSATATETIYVGPKAVDDGVFVTGYVTPVNGDAATADVYLPGSTFTKATNPGHGSVVMNANGTYTYTPASGFTGTDTFTYRVTDPNGASAVATETLLVGPGAINDTVTTFLDKPVNGDVKAADVYLPGSTFVKTSDPTHGTVTYNADGTYTYTPDAGYMGSDTFTYRVTDPNGQTATATETILVGPKAVDDSYTTPYVTPLNGDASTADTYPPGSTFAKATNPGHGTVTVNANGTYTYTPAAGFTGTDTFTYRVTDPNGVSATATETIIVGPGAISDTYSTPFETAVNGDVKAGDVYLSGSTFVKTGDPTHGTVTYNADGTYTYTPDAGFTGTDTFTYRVTDPNGLTATATETIHVGPNAVSDSYTTPYVTAVNGDASTADVYLPGSTFAKATNPAHGTVTVNANGTYTYTPAAGFTGTDTFTYRVTDPNGVSATATETIIVGPHAVNDTYSTPFETAVNGDVKAADLYVTGSTFAKTSDPTHGTVTYNADGTYTYTPDAGFTGTDTFTYRVTDPNGLTATATETIHVGPNAVSDSYTTPYVTAVNGDASTADVYLPGSTFAKATNPGHGTVTVNANGTYTYTPAAGFTGTDTFTYRVTDPNGVSATATETIIVGPHAVDDAYTTQVDTPLNADVKSGDLYLAGSTYTQTGSASHGTVSLNADGTYTYTPDAGFTGTDTFTYRVTDPNGLTATATETILVNAAPVLGDPDATAGTPFVDPGNHANLIVPAVDNVSVSVPLVPYFTDPNGDPVTITPDMTGLPPWLSYDAGTKTLSGTPPSDNAGDVVVPVTVTDNHGGTYAATITIHPTNPAPVANPDTVTTDFETPVVVDLTANDSDPDHDPVTVTSATLADPSQGSLSKDPVSGAWTFSPAPGFTGMARINYTITDIDGGTASSTHDVYVRPNAVDDAFTTQLDTQLNANAAQGDTYLPGSTFTQTGNPSHGTVSLNADGTYTYTPDAGFTGTDTFTYRVTDPNGRTATATETIFVNTAPTLVDPDTTPGTPFVNPADSANLVVPAVDNVPVSVPLDTYFTDANGDPRTLAPDMTGVPAWVTYDPVTHSLGGTPPVDNAGPVDISVTVTDTHGGTYIAKITIDPANPAPVAHTDVVATPIDTPVTVDLLANDTDADGDPLHVVTASVDPAKGSVDFNGTDWVFTPKPGFTGTATITYTIADQDGAMSSSTHDVHVGVAAVAEGYTTQVDTPVAGNAAQGDTYSPGSTFTVTIAPAHGTVSMNADGTYTYTPDAGFTGVDTFTYKVVDTNGQSATAVDTITVNKAPVLSDPDAGAGTPYVDPVDASNLIVPAVDNTNVSVPLPTYFSDANGDPMTITPDMTGAPAWLSYDPVTKTLSGTPPVGNVPPVVVQVTVSDNHGGTFLAKLTIVPANPAPVANADSCSTVVDTPVIVDLLGNDSDPDGDTITVVSATSPQGTLSQDASGHWVFTPNAGFTGTATVSYTIRDADGATASSTHTVTVAPLAAVDDSYTALYATPFHGDAAAADTFPAGSTFSVATLPGHGSVTMNADGTYTYTPSAGFAGTDTFRYTITDSVGNKVTATETIKVTPPSLVAVDDSYTTAFRTPVQGKAATGDTFAAGSVFALTSSPASGTVVMKPDGTYTYTPASNFAGTVTFTYRITDPVGQVATAIETIVVSPPKLVATDDKYSTGYGVALKCNAAAGDTYASGSKFVIATKPGNGTVVMNANGTFTYVPRPGFSGIDKFTYTITDPTGKKVTATETITVAQRPALHTCLTTFGHITGLIKRL